MAVFGPAIEGAGGIEEMDQHLLGEMMAFVITKDQIKKREAQELAAIMGAAT